MAPLAHARGVALALEAQAPVWIRGEPTLLNEVTSVRALARLLIVNLLSEPAVSEPAGGAQ